MPTNPTPAFPKTTSPVQPRVQRVQLTQTGASTDLQRVQTQLSDRLDELLKFVSGAFGAPTVTKTTGAGAVQAGSSQQNAATDRDIILKGSATVTGTLNAASVVSAAGFRCVVGPFVMAANSPFSTTDALTYLGCVASPATNLGAQVFGFRPAVSGSILHLSGVAAANSVAKTFTVTAYKNGNATPLVATCAVAANGFTPFSAVASKGAIPFAKGDLLEIRIRTNSATGTGTEALNGFLTVEMAA